ncbi:MAG: hypothetical protein ACLRVT_00080 [Oscillospiraceae bacterium]
MKKAKRMAAVVLCLCVVALCMGFTQQRDAGELAAERAMSRQEEALDAYQLLWDSFEKEPESLQPYYPDEYGGEYIDDDKLVIQLTENTPENQAKYRELCGNSDKVVFEKVTYSLNYLNSLESQAELLSKDFAVTGYGVKRQENKFMIAVEQQDLTAVQQRLMRQRSSAPIEIVEGEYAQTLATSLPGGTAITNEKGSGLSVCMTGYYQGSPALVTCGHGKTEVGKSMKYGGSKIGTVSIVKYQNNYYGDYSITKLDSVGYLFSSVKSQYGTKTISGTRATVSGASVARYGDTTKYDYGVVSITNYTILYMDGYNIKGLTVMSQTTKDASYGDSGGCVYTQGSPTYVTGIISGHAPIPPDGGRVFLLYTPIAYVTDLGFSK